MASDKDSILLNSFAGSGTTLHAALNLNARAGGRRQYLLIEMEDYARVIRRSIGEVQTAHALEEFDTQLTSGELVAGRPYTLPARRTVARPASLLAQSLYEREEDGNSLEAEIMVLLASADNIAFWTRNPVQKDGFRLNGPVLNCYSDFIAQTHKGHVLLIEIKGDDRDNSDSTAKIRLGKA